MDVLRKEYDDVHALRSQVHYSTAVFSVYLSMEYNEVSLINHFPHKMANGLVVLS
jgi:hypothetical protein